MTSVTAMRDYRRACLAKSSWGGMKPTFFSDEWKAKALPPQTEAVSVARRMAGRDALHESTLAGALYVLGAVNIELGLASSASAPLREAESCMSARCW